MGLSCLLAWVLRENHAWAVGIAPWEVYSDPAQDCRAVCVRKESQGFQHQKLRRKLCDMKQQQRGRDTQTLEGGMRHGRWGVGLWFSLQVFSIFEAFIKSAHITLIKLLKPRET